MDGSSRAARLAAVLEQRGAPMTLRVVNRSSGPQPLVNPPEGTEQGLALDAGVAAGSTLASIRSVLAVKGRLAAGDILLVGTEEVALVADAAARAFGTPVPGFEAASTTPFEHAWPEGTPVVPTFAADFRIYGLPGSMPTQLIDGTNVQMTDLGVTIANWGIPVPLTAMKLLFAGRTYEIKSAMPAFERGDIVSWRLQAR